MRGSPSSKQTLCATGGLALLVLAILIYSIGGLGNTDEGIAIANVIEPLDIQSHVDDVNQSAGEPETITSSDERAVAAIDLEIEPESSGESEGGEARFANYEEEMALYLNSFVGDLPDLIGWTDYLASLAVKAELDLESVYSDEKGTHGVLILPGSELTMDVSILDSGYSLKVESKVQIHTGETVKFHSILAGPVKGGNVETLHGIVQFYPSGQDIFNDNPMGYIYETKDGESSFRPMTAVYNNDRFSINLEGKDKSKQVAIGNLTQPYALMLRLQELALFVDD